MGGLLGILGLRQELSVFETPDLEGVVRFIREAGVRRAVVLCGAGLSTSAGIPDFRTPGSGLYDNLQKYELPRAEDIFTLRYFRHSPGAFYELAKDMWPGNYQPTLGHYFIRLLHEKGLLLRCFTQNIDSLERQAGVPEKKVVAAHGNFDTAHVIGSNADVHVQELKDALDKGEPGWRALAKAKGGLVKPRIVFFGEELPSRFHSLRGRDLGRCDLLLVLGSSLVVRPFADLVGDARPSAPRLLINRDPAGEDIHNGFCFDDLHGPCRDVFLQGEIDDVCRKLARGLGWEQDLDALIQSNGNAQIQSAPWIRT